MKVLLVGTNQDTSPIKGGKTGLWFSELVYFYEILSRKQLLIDIVSPEGGCIPIDEKSLDLKDELLNSYYQSPGFMQQLHVSKAAAGVNAKEYRVVYFAGGHGAMWDFPDHPELQAITRDVYESGGMVTAVGHGVSALLNVMLSDGDLLIRDKYLTGFSNMEEKLASFVREVPFYLEDQLTERGANFTKALIPFTEHIELDERLITGQNPNSARKVATKLVEELWEK